MTWGLVLGLSGAAFALKFLGAVVIGQRTMAPALQRSLLLIPAALLAGLITKDTFTTGQEIVLDERALGLAVAVVATWRRMPFIVVIVLGVGSTALLRALG